LSPICAFISGDPGAVETVYERRMLQELEEIVESLPHSQLSLQWDANFEFAMLNGTLPSWFGDVRAGVVERIVRLAGHVPPDVELGYHFCHGHDQRYLPNGRDVKTQVDVANALAASLSRPLNWLHLPLPLHRLESADYEPLALLRLDDQTELYLGVISPDDGEIGAHARISMAERYIEDFGVATVCGWGRMQRSRIPQLIELHATLTSPLILGDSLPRFAWPEGFVRVPDDPWVSTEPEETGLAYDRVEGHSWYTNLDPTVVQLADLLANGGILVDYSGGTGILLDRLKSRLFGSHVGTVIVDSSPKFLRVALEKFRDDSSVALRQLRVLPEEGRLQRLDEVLGTSLISRGVDVIASTNAIHLYPDLTDTARAWTRALRPGGTLLVNSGNIRNPRAHANQWILDETVWVISDLAEGIVRTDDGYAAYRATLDNVDLMKQHVAFRDRVFLEPRPLSYYIEALEGAGLRLQGVREATIEASVSEWFDFLCVYHDAVLGWVGGTQRVEGNRPSSDALRDRLLLIRHAIDLLFGSRSTFQVCWTYLTCTKPT
jgi:SAM-dependent methyltransferase